MTNNVVSLDKVRAARDLAEATAPLAAPGAAPAAKVLFNARQHGKSMAALYALPWPALVDLTMSDSKPEAAKAIMAFHARLGTCDISWDDLTTKQQGRWSELVQGG